MKEIPEHECAILPLVLKGKWYDLIAAGEKKEEYRDAKPFWSRRLEKWLSNRTEHFRGISDKCLVVGFSRGYRKPDMFFLLRHFEKRSVSINPEWGEPQSEHFVLGLGGRVSILGRKRMAESSI